MPDTRLTSAERVGPVLLAEDSQLNQRVAVAMLERLGLQVDVVADGAEAVRVATETRHGLILMDCQLPVLDGYEATRAIRRIEGAARHTPIIAVTASSLESDHQLCLAAGMDECLAKPLRLASLSVVLARWLPDVTGIDPVEPLHVARDIDQWVPQVDPERPVLDERIINRLHVLGRASGEELVAALAVMFITSADVHLGALRSAIKAGDGGAVARSAHVLSGASANVGATDLARLAAAMATDSGAGDLTGIGPLLVSVETELGLVCSALDRLTEAS